MSINKFIEKIKDIAKQNQLISDKNIIAIAIVFFIVYKFILIALAFKGRNLVPEPDDSYIYINLISLVYEHGLFSDTAVASASSYSHILYIPYVVVMALLSKILYLSPEEIYKYSFYFGTVFLAFTLSYFMNKFTKNKYLSAFTIFMLAFYNGSGAYHGFYWVVPSYFAFLLFLILFSQLISKSKYWHIWSIVTSLLFVLIHPISIYASSLFIIWPIVLSVITYKIEWEKIKRGSYILFFSIFWFILSRMYFLSRGIKIESESSIIGIKRALSEYFGFLNLNLQNVNEKQSISEIIRNTPATNYIQNTNWDVIKIEYFNVLFPNPIFILIFVTFIIILYKKNQFFVLSLYISASIFLLLSSVTWFGYRALGYLWPATFILIAYGIFFTFKEIIRKVNGNNKIYLLSILYTGVLIFIIFLSTINYVWSKNLNIRNDYNINQECIKNILKVTKNNDQINYDGNSTKTILFHAGLSDRKANINELKQNEGEFLISKATIKKKYYTPTNSILKYILNHYTRTDINSNINKINVDNKNNFIQRCGDFNLYQINKDI